MVRDEDHGALLDRRRDPLRRRLRALLQVLPAHPAASESARLRRSRAPGGGGGAAERARRRGRRSSTARSGTRTTLALLDGVDAAREVAGRARRARRSSRRRASAGSRSGRRSSSASGCSRRPARASSASPGRTARRRRPSCSARSSGRPVATSPSPGTSARRSRRSSAADWVVCELSSFQLEDVHELRLRRRRAAQPRARPPRPPRHASTPTGRRSCASSSAPRAKVVPARPRARRASSSPPTTRCPAEPLIRGAHNRENAAAATAAARAAGIDDEAIAEALRTFPGVPHRLELVGEARRRPLRQRLEGDERRRRAARARRVSRRAGAPDPRRLAEGRELRAARRGDRRRTSARST